MQCRDPLDSHPLHVVNLEVTDNASEAAKGAQLALQFCLQVRRYSLRPALVAPRASRAPHITTPQCEASENLEQDMPRLVEEFENSFERPLCYALFYV